MIGSVETLPEVVPRWDGEPGWAVGPLDQDSIRAVLRSVPGAQLTRTGRGVLVPAGIGQAAALADLAVSGGWSWTAEVEASVDRWLLVGAETSLRSDRLHPAGTMVAPVDGLRPYQLAGLEAVAATGWRAIIGDDPGAGKTALALAVLEAAGAWPAVVTTKPSLRLAWVDEVARWLPHRSVTVIESTRPAPVPAADLTIVGYPALRDRLADLTAIRPAGLIADESHNLKTAPVTDRDAARWHTARAQGAKLPAVTGSWRTWAAHRLARTIPAGNPILALTGTPAPNRHGEWWPQIQLIGRDSDLGGQEWFEQRYTRWCPSCVDTRTTRCEHRPPATTRGRPNVDGSINGAELGRRLRQTGILIRRTERQLHPHLPPVVPVEHRLPLTPAGRAAYRKALGALDRDLAAAADRTPTGIRRAVPDAARRYIQLRQLAAWAKLPAAVDYIAELCQTSPAAGWQAHAAHLFDHPDTHGEPGVLPLDDIPAVPSAQLNTDAVGIHGDRAHKAVVFAWHQATQHALCAAFPDAPTILAGQSLTETRDATRRFQTDPDCRLIICSIGAAAEGHTLTAAGHVVAVELPWSSDTLRQMVGRAAYRASDPHTCYLHLLHGDNTIDLDIAALIDTKRVAAATKDNGHDRSWTEGQALAQLLAARASRPS